MRALLARALLSLLLLAGGSTVHAQFRFGAASDPNMDYPTSVLSVARDGYTITGLVTQPTDAKALRYGILLFPGYPGILRLREEAGQPLFELRGNFLVRSRRHWLDEETLVVVIDAPGDQWGGFSQYFRTTQRYGEDVSALVRVASERYGVSDWTAVGTSEGSVSAFHAARMNPQLFRRLILTASVFEPSRHGPGLTGVNWESIGMPLLWVHHVGDPCPATPFRSAEDHAAKNGAPLIVVRGGQGSRGNVCDAFTAHGFIGVEAETVLAMRSWVKTGKAVPQVGE